MPPPPLKFSKIRVLGDIYIQVKNDKWSIFYLTLIGNFISIIQTLLGSSTH